MAKKEKSKLRKKRIHIFMRWNLQMKGCSDAKNNIADKSEIAGFENYYYTPFIGEQITGFIGIAEDEFSRIREKLAELNQAINNHNHDGDARFQRAVQEINDIKKEIANNKSKPQTPHTMAVNDSLESDIVKVERVARADIQGINGKGSKDEYDAKKLVEDFNIRFHEGLIYCVERLAIYWNSLYTKNRKLNTGIKINAQLPKPENFLEMCHCKRPENEDGIKHYNVISLEEIEKIRSRK